MGAARLAQSDGPLYLQVADRLESTIGRRSAGDLMPSEHELARLHRVSRLTARAALGELERRYLVRRAQGRGTFVAQRLEYPIGPDVAPSFSATVRMSGAIPRSKTVELRMRRPLKAVRDALRLAADRSAVFLARKRYVNGELAGYAESWLAADLVPSLGEVLRTDGSLYASFANVYALAPTRGSSRAEYVIAPAWVAEQLETDSRPMTFRLDGRTDSMRSGRPIEVTTSWLRADVFRVVFALGSE